MSRSFLIIVVTAILISVVPLSAQESSKRYREPTLGIQLIRKLGPEIVAPIFWPPDEGSMDTGTPNRLPGKLPHNPPLTRLKIKASMESETAARINVVAVFDDSEAIDSSGPKYGRSEAPLASYSAKEGETITVNELGEFGFESLILKVVRYQPEPKEPARAPIVPEVINQLKALEVVGLVPTGFEDEYRLTLRNVSAKNIVAIDITIPHENGGEGIGILGDKTRPAMRVGATTEVFVKENRGRRKTDRGWEWEPLSNKIIVAMAVFDDETFEGDAQSAFRYVAQQTARRLQLAKGITLLESVLESPDQNRTPAAVMEQLKTDVARLRIDVDSKIIDELLLRFPPPKTSNKNDVTQLMMHGMQEAREKLLRELASVEDTLKSNLDSFASMWGLLKHLKQELESVVNGTELIPSSKT